MHRFLFVTAILVSMATHGIAEDSQSVPEYLQGISVTVKADSARGSGTLVSRLEPATGDTISFILTAGHVVDKLRNVRKIVTADGKTKILVEFKDPRIVAELYQDGRRVGEHTLDCKVIKYSDYEYGEDLAVLMVRRKNSYSVDRSAKFPADPGYIPPIGMNLSHCGSLLGKFGSNSYTTGVLSQTGRLLEGQGAISRVFDQVTAVAFPGSSGGGVYLQSDGTYIGMLTRGTQTQGFNFIVPVRRMHSWAKSAGVLWAIDSSVAMPTLDEIDMISVEDAGAVPSGSGMGYSRTFNGEEVINWLIGDPLDDCPYRSLIQFTK